jgi:hypothetical protein
MAATMDDRERNRKNLRMALILASIAAALFVGFIAKFAFLSH